MALSVGTRLGPYEVVCAIGAGGMGEVYRARDTKLNRDVALKVLPDLFAADPERLARFRREAQVLASLNHPNIAIIHGLEEADGVKALVMEFVEGATVAERLERRPIPVEEALPIARQIADALEAAHEQGIVHRDLKPANIKITPGGTVKVLDFGLAKALDPTPLGGDLSQAPTLTTPAATQMGVIMGTAAYMSPEQAKGKPVDKRTDIWAFGCVLYEMLTGQPTFAGETVTEVVARILEREPDLGRLPGQVPAGVRRLLARCLDKDPKRRLRDIGEARLELQAAPEPPVALTQPARVDRLSRDGLIWSAASLIVGAVTTGLAVWMLMRPEAPAILRVPIPLGAGENFNFTGRHLLALSPDGRRLVYQANLGLYLRPLDQLEASLIRGTDEGGGRSPFFSPDGEWIGFYAAGELKKVSITGGAPVALGKAQNPWGVSWEADDTILFGQGPEGIWKVPGTGGTPEILIPVEEGEQAQSPQMLPGGEWVLFTLRPKDVSSWDDAQIVVQSIETGERQVLISGGRDARYVPSGHLVYGLDGVLFAVPFDVGSLRVTGGPVSLVEGIGVAPGQTGAVHFSVARNGSLVYAPGVAGVAAGRILVWVDRNGQEQPLAAEPRAYTDPRVSPNGSRIALTVRDPDNTDVWVWNVARETLTRLTFDATADQAPLWTEDGSRIVFSSGRDGGGLFWQSADGTGAVERLLETTELVLPHDWARDGRLVFVQFVPGALHADIRLLRVENERTVERIVATEFFEFRPAVSPDGRWLAYESNDSGQTEIYVRPFPDVDQGRWQVSRGVGSDPKWSPDGRELFYLGPDSMMAVPVERGSTFTYGSPAPLFPRSGFAFFLFQTTAGRYDIAPDGRFLMTKGASAQQGDDDSRTPQIVFVQNWFEELRARVPGN